MSIDSLPSAPAVTDAVDVFDAKAFALVAALSTFVAQANAQAAAMQANADMLSSLISAMSTPGFVDSSSTSLAIGTGSKALSISAGKAYQVGQVVYLVKDAGNWMRGAVSSYSGTALVVAVDTVLGNGTYGSWTVCMGNVATLVGVQSINGGPLAGLRNRIINGEMRIDQRNSGASQTFAAGAALAYCVDRWYAYCTGANVTGQRVAGTAPNQYNYQFTGAASVTKIGMAQRIEAANSQDLAGTTATFAVDLANSLLTTVTWTAWRANSADTFGTLAAPTRTQIGTGTFTVSSVLTRYSAQISVPSAATTGIEIELSVGAQTSGTFTVGRAQFEGSGVATAFEQRPLGLELILAERYYYKYIPPQAFTYLGTLAVGSSSGAFGVAISMPVELRALPTVSFSAAGHFIVSNSSGSPIAVTAVTPNSHSQRHIGFLVGVASGLTAGNAAVLQTNSLSAWISADAEL